MYKKQLVFQKIACLLAILAAAVCFVYSLGIMTDLYDSLYDTMRNPNDLTDTKVPGSIIYYDMQPFNKAFVNISIVLILCACLLFLMNTHVRRKFYIGNFAAIAIFSGVSVYTALWSHAQIEVFKHQYLTTVDFEALKSYSEKWNKPYVDSTFLFDVHYFVAGALLLAVVLLIANAVWKVLLMRGEKKLIEGGKEAAV